MEAVISSWWRGMRTGGFLGHVDMERGDPP